MVELHPAGAALKRICADLGLPPGDAYTQDWAYELGEEYRTEAWVYKCLDAYQNRGYGSSERCLLVEVVLDIVNDLLQQDESVGRKAWARAVEVIQRDFSMHRAQVEYWAVVGEALEDAFVLTPLARELLTAQGGGSQ